jgi:predicted dehydrogenase
MAKAPLHEAIVSAALLAKKAVYCEWPLGVDAEQSAALAKAAREQGVVAVCGTQGRGSIESEYVAGLIRDGFIGHLLSVSLMATGIVGIARLPAYYAYSLDKRNAASMLTLLVGHTLAMWQDMFGPLAEVSARLAVRQPWSTIIETGEKVAKTAHDQVLIHGVLEDCTPLAIHYRAGMKNKQHHTG